jgi:hypothetical protein
MEENVMASISPLKAIVERIIEQKKLQGVDIMKKPPKPKAEKKPKKKAIN